MKRISSRTAMNKHRLILLFAILALVAAAPFSNAQAQQLSESRLAQLLKRFPAADANGDGVVSRNSNRPVFMPHPGSS